jgi:hypothetical protein
MVTLALITAVNETVLLDESGHVNVSGDAVNTVEVEAVAVMGEVGGSTSTLVLPIVFAAPE